ATAAVAARIGFGAFTTAGGGGGGCRFGRRGCGGGAEQALEPAEEAFLGRRCRSEEHTSELQSREKLVCRLLLEKKNTAARPTSLCGKRSSRPSRSCDGTPPGASPSSSMSSTCRACVLPTTPSPCTCSTSTASTP